MILYFLGGKPLPYSERNVDGLKTESENITEDASTRNPTDTAAL